MARLWNSSCERFPSGASGLSSTIKEDCPGDFENGNAPLLGVGMTIFETGSEEASDTRQTSQKRESNMVDRTLGLMIKLLM